MEKITTAEDIFLENKIIQENILLDIIYEVCADPTNNLPPQLRAKVNKIIKDCDLFQHTSLHRLDTVNEYSSTVLGLMHNRETDLTFDEKVILNQAINNKIQQKMPKFMSELEKLYQVIGSGKKSRTVEIKKLEQSLEEKISILKVQEVEKVELTMEWLNHRLQEVSLFSSSSYELLSLKTRILELKSHILHLQILRNVFTETMQSIRAYAEIQRDLAGNMRDTQRRIMQLKAVIKEEYE